jgi:Protein of unknown function (DUF2934)
MAAKALVIPKVSPKKKAEPAHLEERIRQRAYEIYLQRDGGEGTDLEDWLQAETEIIHTVEQNYVHREEGSIASRE